MSLRDDTLRPSCVGAGGLGSPPPGYEELAVFSGCPEQAIGPLERALALRAIPGFGWQYVLLAGLRERSGETAAAVAALGAARGCFEQLGERRGLAAAAGLGARLGAGERGVKRMQSPRP